MLDKSTRPSVCWKLSVCVCVYLACRWTATTTVQLVTVGLTVKTEKVLFRQCRRIRTASWGSKVRESHSWEINRLWALSVWNKIQTWSAVTVCKTLLLLRYFLSTCSSYHLPLVYIFNHLVCGSLPLVVTPDEVCFKIWCSVQCSPVRAGPSQNNAALPLAQSLSGPCNWSQRSPEQKAAETRTSK